MTYLSTTSTPGLDRLIRTIATPPGCPPLGVVMRSISMSETSSATPRETLPASTVVHAPKPSRSKTHSEWPHRGFSGERTLAHSRFRVRRRFGRERHR